MAQNDCTTRISAKLCDTTAKYLSHEVDAKPRAPNKATLYKDCKNRIVEVSNSNNAVATHLLITVVERYRDVGDEMNQHVKDACKIN